MNGQLNLTNLLDAQELARCIDDAFGKKDDLNELRGAQVLFSPNENMVPLNGWFNIEKAKVNMIDRCSKKLYVASIDSSSIFLADTPDGSIYAAKCGIAIAYDSKQVMHFKIGPTLFYINEANVALLDHDMVKRMIRVKVERALQKKLANTLRDAIILIDGSLKISIFEDNENHLTSIINDCKDNNNILIGISKVTRLKAVERLLSLLSNTKDACYLDITPILRSYISNLLGNQLLVKLSRDGLVLRLDIINEPDKLSLLCSNDMLHNGYPETLRLAHHLSVFTKTEVLATISIISSRFNICEIDGYDARRMLLGKIGGK